MTKEDITLSRQDAGQIKDVLNALHHLLTTDDLAQPVAQRFSDGPFGSTFGVEAARYHYVTALHLAETVQHLADRLPTYPPED